GDDDCRGRQQQADANNWLHQREILRPGCRPRKRLRPRRASAASRAAASGGGAPRAVNKDVESSARREAPPLGKTSTTGRRAPMPLSRRGFLRGSLDTRSGAFIAARGLEAHVADAAQGDGARALVPP